MESVKIKSLSIEIPNYQGPLEVLLDLAKTQKVDLASISITKLADQFLQYIKDNSDLNLEEASEYLLMATWLAYLKSKLLLPEDDDDDFKAHQVAEKLKVQLKKLELIRLLSDQLLKKKRIGRDIFYRGMKGGIRSIYTPTYDVSLYDLLKCYAEINIQKSFKVMNIPKLPVLTTEAGIKEIKDNLHKLNDWTDFKRLIPEDILNNHKMKRSGLAGIFAATLELTKEGILKVMQEKSFEKILVKKNN
tara:strand:- start:843 stop:1583 length:741 start_codon:yes stop_codon:yes gene_type:complete